MTASTDVCAGRVSVIVPIFNRAQMLETLLRSIAAQSYRDVEVIVVDDGSDDLDQPSFDRITQRVDLCGPVQYLRKNNGGVASARNLGVRHSLGEYLYFLDSDDLIFPDALRELVDTLRNSDDAYCIARIVDVDFSLAGALVETHRDDPGNILRSALWCTHASLYLRGAVLALGGFDETLRIGEDTIFQMRVRLAYGVGARCPSFVGVRRKHCYGHLSVDGIHAADRNRLLVAMATSIGSDAAFRRERLGVRLTSMAVFVKILAQTRHDRSGEVRQAFRMIADALLHDVAPLQRVARWLSSDDADHRLAGVSGVMLVGVWLRSVVVNLRRRQVRRADAIGVAARISDLAGSLPCPPAALPDTGPTRSIADGRTARDLTH